MARGQGMDLPGIDTHWNVDDPAASERAFRTLRHGALASGTTALRAELLTQFDRAHDVRGAFEAARSPLDEAAALVSFADRRARTRHLLESGRLLTRADDPAGATPLFSETWALARLRQLAGGPLGASEAARPSSTLRPDVPGERMVPWCRGPHGGDVLATSGTDGYRVGRPRIWSAWLTERIISGMKAVRFPDLPPLGAAKRA